MKRGISLLAVLSSLVLMSSCHPDKKADPSVILEAFIPHGWEIEFDTVLPLLDGGRTAHVSVMKHTVNATGAIGNRMLSIVGTDAKGKLQRYGASEALLPAADVSSAAYVPPLTSLLKFKKDVISVFTTMSAAPNESFQAREEFKVRFDKASGRFQLIGYDLTDITDGVVTTDSRNYPTGNRVIEKKRGDDVMYHRPLRVRHSGPFLEDLQPWQLAVSPEQLLLPRDQIPETRIEAADEPEPEPLGEPTDSAETKVKIHHM